MAESSQIWQTGYQEASHPPAGAMSLDEEITMLWKRFKEIRCLKKENQFLKEVGAFLHKKIAFKLILPA